MSRHPSPLFIAALDARNALELVEDKLRNVRRRDVTKSERYALNLLSDKMNDIEEDLNRRDVKAVMESA